MEVHASSTKDGFDPIARGRFEAAAIHAMLAFRMIDPNLNRCSPLHPTPKAIGRHAPTAFIYVNFNFAYLAVTLMT